jgi:hypothetical protein
MDFSKHGLHFLQNFIINKSIQPVNEAHLLGNLTKLLFGSEH